jgi:PPE-repeat protein
VPHFAWLPPEINSARIFAGPGAAPLLAAAAAWSGLAENLASSASSFSSVTSDLANSSWQGASSAAMMAVAAQYASWLRAAAAQAEAASNQASAVATAFEAAMAATVQPAAVAANRALGQALAATNWLGQNAPAIADVEAAYEQMWASDVAAMFGYHADASAATAQLTPWREVLQSLGFHFTNPANPSTIAGSLE